MKEADALRAGAENSGMERQSMEKWTRRAIALSWFTVLYNLLEGVVSIGFGVADDSVALAGFGVDSLIEVASAGVVLWRFGGETGRAGEPDLARERLATRMIAGLFLLLAVLVAVASVSNLLRGEHPETTLPGVLVSSVSISCMFYLWKSKQHLAVLLDSRTVAQDAACSLACIRLSFVLLLGSGIYVLFPTLGWLDSAAALVMAAFIGWEGWEAVRAAAREDFTGGCCGCD